MYVCVSNKTLCYIQLLIHYDCSSKDYLKTMIDFTKTEISLIVLHLLLKKRIRLSPNLPRLNVASSNVYVPSHLFHLNKRKYIYCGLLPNYSYCIQILFLILHTDQKMYNERSWSLLLSLQQILSFYGKIYSSYYV